MRRLVTIDRMLSQAVAIALLPLLACASVPKRSDENSLPVVAHALSETRVRAIDEGAQDCIKAEADHSPRRYREIDPSWCELASGGWDARNTLTAVYDNGALVGQYDYDRSGLRVKRAAQGQQVEYVLDDKFVLSEHDGSTPSHSMKRRYHYAAQPLAESEVSGASRFTTWLGVDAQGSVSDATQADGTVRTARQYDAWGQYRNGTAPSSGDPKLGYTGHQYDPETGLVYARARYYDSEIGIFLSRDPREAPVGDSPWLHRYAYTRGNPTRYIDVDGLDVGVGAEVSQREDTWIQGNVQSDGSIAQGPANSPPPQSPESPPADEMQAVQTGLQASSRVPCSAELGRICTAPVPGDRNAVVVTEDNKQALKAYATVRNAVLHPRNGDADLAEGYNAVYGIVSHPNGPPPPSGLLAPKVWGTDYTKAGLSEEDAAAVEQIVQSHDSGVRQRYWTGVAAGVVSLTGDVAGAADLAGGRAAASAGPRAYSTAFEARLSPSSYPGVSRARHFQEANGQLLAAMEADPQFAAQMEDLGIALDRTPTALAPRTPPPGWTWHHEVERGVLRLVPREQHTPGSAFWDLLHPGGRGGYSIWGQ